MSTMIPPTASLFRSSGELVWLCVYNACILVRGGSGVQTSLSLHGASMRIVHKNSYTQGQKVIEKFGKDPRRLHFLFEN